MYSRSFASAALWIILCCGTACVGQIAQPASRVENYFVDCGSSIQTGDGRSEESPWITLDQVNGTTFHPGDVVHFKRDSVCHGVLSPQGSGSENASIRMTAYGVGARPKIVADATKDAVLKLYNQEYWEIDSLDFSGSNIHGVFISGDKGILHHIHLANLLVHDIGGEKIGGKETGLVIISPGSVEQHFDDVLVDGVIAYNTRQWAGILVGGGNFGYPPESTWNTRVIIRNSLVHDVQGDGIVLFRVRDGRIASSIAWNIGMQPTETIGTPNAIWTWMCRNCVVEQSEAFLTDSPGVDGGAFDIDYGNRNNSVIDSYGHDTQGYCVAIFGAGFVTHQSIVRGNTCVNNGRSPRMAQFQGAIFVHTWNEGALDGVDVENNTIYWTPPQTAPAILNDAVFQGNKGTFRNNRIYSTSPWMITSNPSLQFQRNQYLLFSHRGLLNGEWQYGNSMFHGFADYQSKSGQDIEGTFRQVVAANSILATENPKREAAETSYQFLFAKPFSDPNGKAMSPQMWKGNWTIYAFLPLELDTNGLLKEISRRQLIILKSLHAQFQGNGLKMVVVFQGNQERVSAIQNLKNIISDAGLRFADFAYRQRTADQRSQEPLLLLLSPERHVVKAWHGFAGAAALGLVVRHNLGDPAYSQIGEDVP